MTSVVEQFKQKLTAFRRNRDTKYKRDLESFIIKNVNSRDQLLSCLIICAQDFDPKLDNLSTRDKQERLDVVRRLFERCVEVADRLNKLTDFVSDMNSWTPYDTMSRATRDGGKYVTNVLKFYLPLWTSLAQVNPVDARPEILK